MLLMNRKTKIVKYIPLIILLISLMLYVMSMYLPKTVPFVYPLWFYKTCSQAFSVFVSIFPFSVAEWIIFLFPLYFLFLLGKGGYLWMRGTGKASVFWHTLGRRSRNATCYLLSIFILSAGINYHRKSLAEHAGLEVQAVTKEDLVEFCGYLAALTHGAGGYTHRSFNQNKKLVEAAYSSLSGSYPVFKGRYPSSKALLLSHWVSYAHIMGFFFPFTFESNINIDIPSFMIPAVIAHEQAHLRGFMREEDAEFTVFLLARYTDDRSLVYSFYLSTLMRSISVLNRADPEACQQLIADFSEDIVADLVAYSDYWSRFRSPVGKISQTVNDAYLKVNSQSDGVQSYGRVVDLLIADYKQLQTIKNKENEND